MSLDDSFIGRYFNEKYDLLWALAVALTVVIITTLAGIPFGVIVLAVLVGIAVGIVIGSVRSDDEN